MQRSLMVMAVRPILRVRTGFLLSLFGLALGISLTVVVWVLAGRNVKFKAQHCLADVQALRLGETPFSDAERLKMLYGGHEYGIGSANCTPDRCKIGFVFQNYSLALTRYWPPVELEIFLGVTRGIVTSREVIYASGTPGAYAQLFLTEVVAQPEIPEFKVRLGYEINGRPKELMVSLTTAASSAQRAQAYSFDLNCLIELGGCTDPSRVLGSLAAGSP